MLGSCDSVLARFTRWSDHPIKQKPPKSGGSVLDVQIAYFGLELPVPVALEPLSVVVVLFLWCL